MIRRFFTSIAIVLLIGFCAYNTWQMQQLQGEIKALQVSMKSIKMKSLSKHRSQLVLPDNTHIGWLDLANKHIGLARDAAAKSDFKTAQRELSSSYKDMKKAAAEPQAKTEAGIKAAHRQVRTVQSQANALLQKVRLGGQ